MSVGSEEVVKTWTDKIDLGHGIVVYKNVLPKSMNIIDRLEKSLSGSNKTFSWREALVGYGMKIPDYRDCVDFKYKKKDLVNDGSEEYSELVKIWDECYENQRHAVKDYCNNFGVGELRYWEAFNFVRYSVGHHFGEHHDHGYSYNCTVSLVSYLNDDYEGGELTFTRQNIKFKAEAGDTVLFPSNYMYPHIAEKVDSGVKYSLVTMLDYSSKFHKSDMRVETGD